jgi:hypothetical protein
MKIDIAPRRALAIFLVASFALISNLIFFGREAKHYTSPYLADELAFYDPWNELAKYRQRFEKIGVQLDANQVAGYISDTGSPTHFSFTQYVLAPVVLARSPQQPIVVGNFKRGMIPNELATNADLILVSDFGNGVALFRSRHK